jgi:hypothetical protein
MSILLGAPGERLPLSGAVDALLESARRAGVPGLVWLAGIAYPSLDLSLELVWSLLGTIESATRVEIPGSLGSARLLALFGPTLNLEENSSLLNALAIRLAFLPVVLLLYRLIVGLARVSDPWTWDVLATRGRAEEPLSAPGGKGSDGGRRRTLRLRAVWQAGRGMGLPAFGMWAMLLGLLLGAVLLLVMPLVAFVHVLGIEEAGVLFVALLAPVLLVLLLYAVTLQILNQLALHSLAHNRRGIVSALTHAWRLVRAAPNSAVRAALVEVSLSLSFLVVVSILAGIPALGDLLGIALLGFVGVTRAGFWARTYRALGGLSPADQVPGLS